VRKGARTSYLLLLECEIILVELLGGLLLLLVVDGVGTRWYLCQLLQCSFPLYSCRGRVEPLPPCPEGILKRNVRRS
jgi:hypothetical protein